MAQVTFDIPNAVVTRLQVTVGEELQLGGNATNAQVKQRIIELIRAYLIGREHEKNRRAAEAAIAQPDEVAIT